MVTIVALTGATGFIGGYLQKHLIRSGVRLRALSRSQEGFDQGVEWIRGSLEDIDSLARLTAGAEIVVHCAGAVRGASPQYFNRVNVDGSLWLLQAAQESSTCKRFLLVSSLAARHPELSWYAASKHQAELVLREAAADLAVTIFRPTAVYGPGDRELRSLFKWMLRGWLPVLGQNDARLTFLHVEDLTRAVLQWVEAPRVASGVYELHDGQENGYSWQELAAIAEEIRNGPVHQIPVPATALHTLAWINMTCSHLIGHAPMLTPAKVRELRHPDWSCDNQPILQDLGWQPTMSLKNSLAKQSF
ncbi:NAD-dependent epimerase/dehydratase family protein [Azomonas macrocytogenes]|uniref:Nucleoside-diphosphate-sugar epimerase n=1 Tax=Azomonas macrocytogenes TaxID=69962 RepID=A0A839SY42_AZOMA|nr:nucleoside-diphosphate-sugar epimerase [Azomonas macrocytogenes]